MSLDHTLVTHYINRYLVIMSLSYKNYLISNQIEHNL